MVTTKTSNGFSPDPIETRDENLHGFLWKTASKALADTYSTNGDTDSTSSGCDSPDSVAYESRASSSSSSRRKQQATESAAGMLAGLVGLGPRSPPLKHQSSSTTAGTSSSTTTTSTTARIQRSSNIPVQRSRRRDHTSSSEAAAHEQALQDHLKQHYNMRTWDMYHRITQAAAARKKKTSTTALSASSIDQYMIPHASTSSATTLSPTLQAFSADSPPLEASSSDCFLEHEMLFPLDE